MIRIDLGMAKNRSSDPCRHIAGNMMIFPPPYKNNLPPESIKTKSNLFGRLDRTCGNGGLVCSGKIKSWLSLIHNTRDRKMWSS